MRAAIVALLPYAIFSLFHALSFTRSTLMPQFLPPGPPATAGGPPTPHPLAKKLQLWVKGARLVIPHTSQILIIVCSQL